MEKALEAESVGGQGQACHPRGLSQTCCGNTFEVLSTREVCRDPGLGISRGCRSCRHLCLAPPSVPDSQPEGRLPFGMDPIFGTDNLVGVVRPSPHSRIQFPELATSGLLVGLSCPALGVPCSAAQGAGFPTLARCPNPVFLYWAPGLGSDRVRPCSGVARMLSSQACSWSANTDDCSGSEVCQRTAGAVRSATLTWRLWEETSVKG